MAQPYVNGGMTAAILRQGSISPKPPQLPHPAPASKPKRDSLTAQQVSTRTVGRELAPILANIRTQNQQDTAARSGAITAATNELAHLYGDYANAPSPYDTSVADASKVEDYLTNRLTAGGHEASSSLASALQGIDANPAMAKALADNAASYGAGLGTTSAGLGGAGLEQLVGDRAARADYASKLPANAALYGLQAIRGLQGEEAKSLSSALAQVENQRPGLINTVTANIQSNQAKKAALKQSAAALGLPDPTLSGKVGYVVDKQGNPVGGKVAPLPGYTVKNGTVTKAAKPVVAKPPTVDNTLSKTNGFLTDTHGNPILRNGKKVALPKTTNKKASAGLTPHEVQTYRGKAYTIADDSLNGYDVSSGGTTTHYPGVDYKTALKRMQRAGIPADIARAELARVGYVSPTQEKRQVKTAKTVGAKLFPSPFGGLTHP